MKYYADINHLDIPWERLRKKSILVTGANGLIGSTFIEALVESNQAYSLDMNIYAMCRSKSKAEIRFGNLLGLGLINLLIQDVCTPLDTTYNFDYIIHAASPSHPLAFSISPVDVMIANIIGTINLLEYSKSHNSRLLYVSSGEVYGENVNNLQSFKESDMGFLDCTNPRSCYPESKRTAETLCASYLRQFQTDSVIARLCYVYGPAITNDNSRADAQFLRNVINKQDIIMKSAGTQIRSYCYVNDAISALFFILLYGKSGEAYNVANKDSIVSIKEYAQTLATCGGVSLRFEIPDEIEKAGYSTVHRSVLDASKLEALGWRAQYDIKQGIIKTLDIVKSNNIA